MFLNAHHGELTQNTADTIQTLSPIVVDLASRHVRRYAIHTRGQLFIRQDLLRERIQCYCCDGNEAAKVSQSGCLSSRFPEKPERSGWPSARIVKDLQTLQPQRSPFQVQPLQLTDALSHGQDQPCFGGSREDGDDSIGRQNDGPGRKELAVDPRQDKDHGHEAEDTESRACEFPGPALEHILPSS